MRCVLMITDHPERVDICHNIALLLYTHIQYRTWIMHLTTTKISSNRCICARDDYDINKSRWRMPHTSALFAWYHMIRAYWRMTMICCTDNMGVGVGLKWDDLRWWMGWRMVYHNQWVCNAAHNYCTVSYRDHIGNTCDSTMTIDDNIDIYLACDHYTISSVLNHIAYQSRCATLTLMLTMVTMMMMWQSRRQLLRWRSSMAAFDMGLIGAALIWLMATDPERMASQLRTIAMYHVH